MSCLFFSSLYFLLISLLFSTHLQKLLKFLFSQKIHSIFSPVPLFLPLGAASSNSTLLATSLYPSPYFLAFGSKWVTQLSSLDNPNSTAQGHLITELRVNAIIKVSFKYIFYNDQHSPLKAFTLVAKFFNFICLSDFKFYFQISS